MEYDLFIIILLFHSTASFLIPSNNVKESETQPSGQISFITWREFCDERFCLENEYCNERFQCECCPGFQNISGNCIPCFENYQPCTTNFDCCGSLMCIRGICRKPQESFLSIGRIGLLMTATAIITCIIIVIIKILLRTKCGKRRANREEETVTVNATEEQIRQYLNQRRLSYEIRQEKPPPSYEECVREIPRRPSVDLPPPPYVISSSVPLTIATNTQDLQNINPPSFSELSSSVSPLPLNVNSLDASGVSGVSLENQTTTNNSEPKKNSSMRNN